MQGFIYNGLRVVPKRKLTREENSLGINLPLSSLGVSNYDFRPNDTPWDYDEFYKVAKENGSGDMDVFICKGVEVIPGTNELFHLRYNKEETYHEQN